VRGEKLTFIVGGALLLWLLASRSYSFGGPDKSGVSRDPSRLLPAFADRLELLFARLRARGFDPMLHEGYRTPARAAELARQKKGIVDSLHIYGAAADIVSKSTGWSNPAFFKALGQEAEAIGLTWGGRFAEVDSTHVQAVPGKFENALRALAAPARDAYVARSMRVA